jgi:hypothetical protein
LQWLVVSQIYILTIILCLAKRWYSSIKQKLIFSIHWWLTLFKFAKCWILWHLLHSRSIIIYLFYSHLFYWGCWFLLIGRSIQQVLIINIIDFTYLLCYLLGILLGLLLGLLDFSRAMTMFFITTFSASRWFQFHVRCHIKHTCWLIIIKSIAYSFIWAVVINLRIYYMVFRFVHTYWWSLLLWCQYFIPLFPRDASKSISKILWSILALLLIGLYTFTSVLITKGTLLLLSTL